MALPIIAALGVGLVWLGRIGLAAFAINEIKNLTSAQKGTMQTAVNQAEAAGMTEAEYKKLVAATTYDQVEQDGQEPNDFWAGLTPAQKEALQFSPDTLRNDMGRTKFLGMASAFLFISALAAGGLGAKRGIPIILSTIAKMATARKAGATALTLMTILEEGKILGIAKVWIPGLVAGVAAAGGWLTSTMTNNLNDASLWGRIFLGQAADDYASAQKQLDKQKGATGSGGGLPTERKIFIRMTEEKQPEQFIGTLFSAKLGDMKSFERALTDEINDENELREDVKLNLNKWLATLPGRLGYSVVIRKDPVDEFGVKQSGIWATLTMHITRLNGPITPIDTILLGPVSPTTRLKLSKVTKVIEGEIPGMLGATEVQQISIPNGIVDIFDVSGNRVDLATPTLPPATPSTPAVGTPANDIPPEVQPPAEPSPGGVPGFTPTAPPPTGGSIPGGTQTTTPSTIPTPTPEPEPTPTPADPPPVQGPTEAPRQRAERLRDGGSVSVFNTSGEGLNIRQGAGTSNSIIVAVAEGTTFETFKESNVINANGFYWVHLKPNPGAGMNGAGWAAADFLK